MSPWEPRWAWARRVVAVGVGLEDTEAVLLVEQEVEVTRNIGLDAVELALVGGGAKTGEGETGGLGLRRAGNAGRQGAETEQGSPEGANNGI